MRTLTISDPALVESLVAAPFNPWSGSYPTPLHAVWAADPAWTNPGDGNPVDSWRNQSGGGDPASTGGNRPTFRASTAALGNRPTVQFVAASSQRLDVDITDINQVFKLLVVGSLGSTGGGERILGTGAGTSAGIGDTATDLWTFNQGNALNVATSNNNPHVWRATLNGVSSQLWLDETSIVSGNAGASSMLRFTIGSASSSVPAFTAPCNGHVHYAAVYAGAASDAGLTALARAFGTYCGITVA